MSSQTIIQGSKKLAKTFLKEVRKSGGFPKEGITKLLDDGITIKGFLNKDIVDIYCSKVLQNGTKLTDAFCSKNGGKLRQRMSQVHSNAGDILFWPKIKKWFGMRTKSQSLMEVSEASGKHWYRTRGSVNAPTDGVALTKNGTSPASQMLVTAKQIKQAIAAIFEGDKLKLPFIPS